MKNGFVRDCPTPETIFSEKSLIIPNVLEEEICDVTIVNGAVS